MSCDIITYIKSQLSKDGPIPLYKQILNLLRAYIASGDCPAGARLPTEAELEEELGVSRVTIRQAMNEAVQEGLVVRKAGKGTYVAEVSCYAEKTGFCRVCSSSSQQQLQYSNSSRGGKRLKYDRIPSYLL